MKDREPKEPSLSLYLSRRQALAVALGIAADLLLPHDGTRAASLTSPSSQRSWEATPDIKALENITVGETTDLEVAEMPYFAKDDIDENLTRYGFGSSIPQRPHIVITEKDGIVQFKRIYVRDAGAWLPAGSFKSPFFPNPEARSAPPLFYGTAPFIYGFQHPLETQIFASEGFARVARRETPGETQLDFYEIHYFLPTTTDDYIRRWGQGDYKRITPRSALILVDGLGSSSNDMVAKPDQSLKGLRDHMWTDYEEVANFSYRGGYMAGMGPTIWVPLSYEPEDTYQSISDSAERLKEMVEQLRQWRIPIDLLGYSLGGVVAWQYLMENVLPENGPHRDNTIRSAVFLDAPLNGIPDASIVNWLQGEGFETHFGNEATSHLAAMASSPERQAFTIATNIQSAQFLKDRRGIEILCLTNNNDCLVEPQSAIIPGFGETLDLGRGVFGIPSCDFIGLAPFSPGNDVANIGHNQILTDPRAEARTRRFLETLS